MFKYAKLLSLCIPTVKGILSFCDLDYGNNITKHILYLLSESTSTSHQNDNIIFCIDLP